MNHPPKFEMKAERRGVRIGRWAIFGIMVSIVVATLFGMMWTADSGLVFRVRLPDSGGYSRCFYFASNHGYLDVGVSWIYGSGATRVFKSGPSRPLVEIAKYSDVRIIDRGVPIWVILAVECIVLFFLVPSVLSKRKE